MLPQVQYVMTKTNLGYNWKTYWFCGQLLTSWLEFVLLFQDPNFSKDIKDIVSLKERNISYEEMVTT
jgi:hypothetical protein